MSKSGKLRNLLRRALAYTCFTCYPQAAATNSSPQNVAQTRPTKASHAKNQCPGRHTRPGPMAHGQMSDQFYGVMAVT
jgi:hypothetical protein